MRKHYLLLLLIFFLPPGTYAQFTRYVVKLKDKTGSSFSINNPSQFLSSKSIERRTKQHISIDETDLPVLSRYIDSIRLSGNVAIINQSKWLNQVCIETTDATALAKIERFPFVLGTQAVKRIAPASQISRNKFIKEIKQVTSPQSPKGPDDVYSYGNSYNQVHMHEGEFLHNKNFRGEGMRIAIMDGGFYHYQSLPAFDSVRLNKQVAETYDFVNNETSVNEDDPHGMQCFSIIAGNITGQLVGSGPKATFYLYRSEDTRSESPVEEQYWIAAAERADSIGVDIISTSLGYNLFDNPAFNYTYADMNGHTTMMAKAAMLAAKKGMIVLAAAGNEGDDPWHYITTPADADSILSVGAVDVAGNAGKFSSYGPSSDGRIEPTVASMGVATAAASPNGGVITGNGTSFATPNLAGLVACLWQAFPEFSNMDIIQSVKKSSNLYSTPNNRIGYGIPNFRIAFEDLSKQRVLKNADLILGDKVMKIYPNPFRDNFTVVIKPKSSGDATFSLYDMAGKRYFRRSVLLEANQPQVILFDDLPPLQRGMYILKFMDGKNNQSLKVLMQ